MKVKLYEELVELSRSDASIVICKEGRQEPIRLVDVPELRKIIDLGLRIEESNNVLANGLKKQLEVNTTLANAIDLLNDRVVELELKLKGDVK